MRLPRVRFTVRWMMVAVAVAALLLSIGGWLWRRSQEFHERAVIHLLACRSNDLETATGSAGAWERAAYHLEMAEKYHRATSRPWLPVAPDPPEPP